MGGQRTEESAKKEDRELLLEINIRLLDTCMEGLLRELRQGAPCACLSPFLVLWVDELEEKTLPKEKRQNFARKLWKRIIHKRNRHKGGRRGKKIWE